MMNCVRESRRQGGDNARSRQAAKAPCRAVWTACSSIGCWSCPTALIIQARCPWDSSQSHVLFLRVSYWNQGEVGGRLGAFPDDDRCARNKRIARLRERQSKQGRCIDPTGSKEAASILDLRICWRGGRPWLRRVFVHGTCSRLGSDFACIARRPACPARRTSEKATVDDQGRSTG